MKSKVCYTIICALALILSIIMCIIDFTHNEYGWAAMMALCTVLWLLDVQYGILKIQEEKDNNNER